MRLQPRQNLLSGLIACVRIRNSIDCYRFRGSGGHGRTDPVGESPRLPHIIQQSFRSGWWRNCQQLTQMNIPYRFSEASGAIEVPADKVHELRLRLAQQGLPKGGAVGFELLDQEKFGISSSANR